MRSRTGFARATLSAATLVALPASGQTAGDDTRVAQPVITVTGTRPAVVLDAPKTGVFGLSTLTILETPQSVQVLTRDLIDTSGALSIGDLFQNVAGASPALGRSVPFGTASTQIRGQDVAIFRDGLRDVDFSDIDQSALNNVARIDVLKGPAGLVYGSGGPGGVVNISTKRPLDRLAAEVRVTLGQRSTKIVAADISVPLAKGLGVRVTGELERSDSYIDFSEIERDNFSAVLAYENDIGSASIVYENFANRDDNAMTRVGLPAVGTIVAGIPTINRSTYLGEPASDFTDSYGTMISAYARLKLGENISINGAGRKTTVNFNQAEVRTLGTVNPSTQTVPRSRARRLALNEQQYNARTFVEAKFGTGQLSHELTAGYEFFQIDLDIANFNVPAAQVTPISVVAPVYRTIPFVLPPTTTPSLSTDQFSEIFVQDVVRAGPVTVTGAIRRVRAKFTDGFGLDARLNETLYQLGAAVRLAEGVSVFGGYNTGYNANSGIAAITNRTGERFAPENYRQFEAGLKTAAVANVTATVSLFDLQRSGILLPDPADAAFQIQAGVERSRGVEADVVWTPTPALVLRAGYLYLDAEIIRDTVAARIGRRRPNAPEHQANAFASYTLLNGPLRNLRLTAGVTYSGDAFASINNTVVRPSYALANFGASYAIDRFRFDAFLTNAFDKTYYAARNDAQVNVGEPRSFRVRGSVAF